MGLNRSIAPVEVKHHILAGLERVVKVAVGGLYNAEFTLTLSHKI